MNSEVEEEVGNEDVSNDVPFDPNDIVVNIVPRTVGQLVEMLEYNEIMVPKFQRLPNLWDLKKKSRFIESLMLNLPIPLFYFDESGDKIWRVIDGLQRISTLEHFILGDRDTTSIGNNKGAFKLENLEFKKEFDGKTWKELPRDVQRRINTVQVTINLIGKGTPEIVKYNIFSRINQGGIELKPQEIRTALFQGYKNDFVTDLVTFSKTQQNGTSLFDIATAHSVKNERQEKSDFITRFISFYLLGYTAYVPDMDSFLTKGTDSIPVSAEAREKIKSAFVQAMELSCRVFGDDAFRKRTDESASRKPINKPLFEIVSVHFSKLTETEKDNLLNNVEAFKKAFIELQINKDFWNAISTGTATQESVRSRHDKFKELLARYTND